MQSTFHNLVFCSTLHRSNIMAHSCVKHFVFSKSMLSQINCYSSEQMERRICNICRVPLGESGREHRFSIRHRCNTLLQAWTQYRKPMVKNRKGISVDVTLLGNEYGKMTYEENIRKGAFKTTVSLNQFKKRGFITYSFTAKNSRSKEIILLNVFALHPTRIFKIFDQSNVVSQGDKFSMKPGDTYTVCLSLILATPSIGTYKMPLVFEFQSFPKHGPPEQLYVAKEMVVSIGNVIKNMQTHSSPFTSQFWDNVDVTVRPNNYKIFNGFNIPEDYYVILACGLKTFDWMTPPQREIFHTIMSIINHHYHKQSATYFVHNDCYGFYFHIMLWLEELAQKLSLEKFNMEKVTLDLVSGNVFKLEVPGLAEKRPSVLRGDIITIRIHEDSTAYQGIVFRVEDKHIFFRDIHEEFIKFVSTDDSPRVFDVKFEVNRITFIRQHEAVDACVRKQLLPHLFPDEGLIDKAKLMTRNYILQDIDFFNPHILHNEQQKKAVLNILNNTSLGAPYIVFGPPGTGKTMTIVEAIMQIVHKQPQKRILVCAPANAACDMLAQKLISQRVPLKKSDLIRIHTGVRDPTTIPKEIIPYSNIKDVCIEPCKEDTLKNYRIVITTLIHCGKYRDSICPDYVFIDEAAQALESELDIAISLVTQGKQIVLAGDPKQLSPICSSKVAVKFGFGVSLLERLMNTNTLYKIETDNENFLTMLKLNYRSHEDILIFSNKFFYENQLKPISEFPINDGVSKTAIYPLALGNNKPTLGKAVEFCAVYGKECRQGTSPSYFNEFEVEAVVKYVEALLSLKSYNIQQSDIGIITPYIRQVYRIKHALSQYEEVEIGTVETFQGREKRIIIISTVRGQHSLLLYDQKYNLGFVSNEKRFNVAITRAISKVIIIGNPLVLGTNQYWLDVIEECESWGSYYGTAYERRTKDVMESIITRMENLKTS